MSGNGYRGVGRCGPARRRPRGLRAGARERPAGDGELAAPRPAADRAPAQRQHAASSAATTASSSGEQRGRGRAGPRRGRPGPAHSRHRASSAGGDRRAPADGHGLRIRTRTPTSNPGSAAATWLSRCRTSPRPEPPASSEITTESMSLAWCTGLAAPSRAEYQASTRRRSPSLARRTTAATQVGGSSGPAPKVRSAISTRRAVSAGSAPFWVSRPGAARRFTRSTPTTLVRRQVRDALHRFGSRRHRLRQVQHHLVRPRVGGGEQVPGDAVEVADGQQHQRPQVPGGRGERLRPGHHAARFRHPVVAADQPPGTVGPGERHGRRTCADNG